MLCLHRGFDGLDVSFAGRIEHEFCKALEEAKERAQNSRRSAIIDWRGIPLDVAESGAKGGYAFRCAIGGALGAVWFFKRPTRGDPWGIRASCRAFGLATKGLGGVRAELYATMDALGVIASAEGESIGRVDYAVDFLAPGFALVPDALVMHSNANRADHIETLGVNGRSGRVTSVTVGKMPGRQVIIYDKRAEVISRCKPAWWEIWNETLRSHGLPELDAADANASSVWRVELRAGKRHLKDDWAIRRWSDLDQRLGDVLTGMMKAIRHSSPTLDSNRSRWPESELWRSARGQLSEDLMELRSSVEPNLVRQVQLNAHDALLSSQMAGLLTAKAALHRLSADELPSYAVATAQELCRWISDEPARFDKKLADAKARYSVLI